MQRFSEIAWIISKLTSVKINFMYPKLKVANKM